MSPRRERGLASRFLTAQLLVVAASILAAAVAVTTVGPPLFHEHLVMSGHSPDSPELLHVEQAYVDTNLITLSVAVATAFVCALLATFWLARRLREPIARLTDAAGEMARGNYATRVPAIGAGAEVEALAGAFNTMAARLEHTEEARRRMLSDLAHEMRTPISVLAVYLEGLQDGVTRWNSATNNVMAEQLARLTRLVEDINDVSRAEEGRMALELARESLAEMVLAAAAAATEAYAAKGVTLRTDVTADHAGAGFVLADRQRLGQVLGNLLSNALRHTPAGGTVTIGASPLDPERVAVRVADTGEGIGAEQLPHVFERFYRGDTARDRDHGGSGIGLTIAQALAEAHGGTLTADSPGPGGGAVFTLVLPRTGPDGPGTDKPLDLKVKEPT
jgi:signal transduction histidine kinase